MLKKIIFSLFAILVTYLMAIDQEALAANCESPDSLTVAMWASYKNLASNNIGLIHIQADDLDNGNPDAKIVGMWVENSSLLWGQNYSRRCKES